MGRRASRILIALFLLGLCGAGTAVVPGASQEAAMFREGPTHTGVADGPAPDGYGGILWRTPLAGPIRSTAAVVGDLVYVGSAGGSLHALDRLSGEERWRYDAGAAVHGSPAVAGGVVYVTDLESTLHAVDARTGRERWRVETGPVIPFPWGFESGDVYVSSPTLARVGGRSLLFFGAGDGALRAVLPRSGEVVWTLETGGRIRSTPAVADGVAVVGSADGVVYAADASTGELLWTHATLGAELHSGEFGFDRRTVQSSPAIADGRVYVGARDGFLYALDLATGERLWRADHEVSWVNSSPAAAGGRVFVGTSDGRFVQAVDAETGEEIWRQESRGIVWTSPLVVGDVVIFAEGGGRIRALDPVTGETRWTIYPPTELWASPVVADGVLYIGTQRGGMYAFRGAGGRPLRRAVVWDSTMTAARWYLDHRELVGWLSRRGYEVLDAEAATEWLDARIRNREPSSVVFAIDHAPGPILEGGADSKLRRYLDSGGTVIWPGYPPGIWPRDPETGEVPGGLSGIDRDVPARVLGVNHDAGNFDDMGAWPTEEGRRLGLPDQWFSRFDVAASEDLEPLAWNERGELASWRKNFGGPPGTGFVRIWGSRTAPPTLTPVLVAAEWRPATPEEVGAGELSSGVEVEGLARLALRPGELRLRVDRFVRRAMERLGAVPGMAVSVATPEGVLMEKGWGLRDVEHGLPVTPETGFYIASSTKSFVALAAALLDREGLLDLDAPLTACIPGLTLNGTVDPDEQTLRDQLRHTRGWDDSPVETRTAYTGFMAPDELLAHLNERAVREGDGSFSYGNIGYVVTDLCFRTHLGRSWKELVETRVLTPAGMTATTPYMSEAAFGGNLAFPHRWDGVRFRAIPHKTDEIMHAAGGLVTTARDGARWLRILLEEGEVDGVRIFPAEVVREILTRQTDVDLSFWEFSRDGYGLGWYDGTYRGERLVHHFGGYPGAQAHISLMPEHEVGVTALVNGSGAGGYLLPHVTAALIYDLLTGKPDAEEHAWATIEDAAVDARAAADTRRESWHRLARLRTAPPAMDHPTRRYVGTYRHPGAGVIDISVTPEGDLWVNWGSREGDLLPLGGDAFLADWQPDSSPDEVHFTFDDEGAAGALVWENVAFRRAPY